MRSGVEIRGCWERVAFGKRGEFLRIPLLDHTETAKLSFETVEVTVMIGVASDEVVAADTVICLDTINDMHWERKSGDPGPAVKFVIEVELGRWSVMDVCF